MEGLEIEAKNKRGRPKLRWVDKTEDLREKGWRKEETMDTKLRHGRIKEGTTDPKYNWEKVQQNKRNGNGKYKGPLGTYN